MRKDKQNALRLRSLGKSYNEIKAQLGVPKSTLSGWLASTQWSTNVRAKLEKDRALFGKQRLQELGKIKGKHLEKLYEQAREEAKDEFEVFKLHPLFIVGISLFWGEGSRMSKYLVGISNTDPSMIQSFVLFLSKVCGMPAGKIRAYLLLYPDLDSDTPIKYWVSKTNLEKQNFHKSVVIQGRHKTRRLQYGVCNVGVCSAYLKVKVDVWLNLLSLELQKSEYYAGIV